MSLEQFTKTLPPDWQVVQLAYVKEHPNPNVTKLSYSRTTNWGTQAYLISRSGMARIVKQFYVGRGKFDLKEMRNKCPKFTADDCLLGFAPDWNVKHVSWKDGMWKVSRLTQSHPALF
jgi:hypothetical protein